MVVDTKETFSVSVPVDAPMECSFPGAKKKDSTGSALPAFAFACKYGFFTACFFGRPRFSAPRPQKTAIGEMASAGDVLSDAAMVDTHAAVDAHTAVDTHTVPDAVAAVDTHTVPVHVPSKRHGKHVLKHIDASAVLDSPRLRVPSAKGSWSTKLQTLQALGASMPKVCHGDTVSAKDLASTGYVHLPFFCEMTSMQYDVSRSMHHAV